MAEGMLRRQFTKRELKRLRQTIEAEEGCGARAQQRVLERLKAIKQDIDAATSGLQRARLRKRLGLC